MARISDLPPRERVTVYRQFAEEAEKHANAASGAIRQSYALIADQWRKLAEELETRIVRQR
jgi:hypothetical protein